MNGRGLTVAAALLALLAGGLWYSNREEAKKAANPPAAKDAPPKILSLTEGDVQKIAIKKRGGEETVVSKDKSGKWQILAPKPYGADQDAVTGLSSSAAAVSSDRLVDEKPADIKQYGLDSPSMEVNITTKNGKTSKLLLGDDAPGGSSTYAKLDGDPRVFTVASFTKTGLDKASKDLRDKRLLTFDQDKLSRLEVVGKDAIEFGRNKDSWQILKPKTLRADGLQVEELVRKLKDAKMDLALSDDDAKKAAASYAKGTAPVTVKVTDASGTQDLRIVSEGGTYYAKSSVVEGIYKVPEDLGKSVTKQLNEFRNKKLFDFGFSEPNKVELHANGKSYSFQKAGEKWMAGGKDMDSTSVQSFLDKLRDLSAAGFVDTGFTTPVDDITVTSDNGKRTEKVLIAKVGEKYIAQRENEPSFYELDAKTVDDLAKAAGDVKPAPPAAKK
jgi:hypothetical protein